MMRKISCMIVFSLIFLLPSLSSGAEDKCIKGNCLNGKGVMEYSDGKQYSGEFLEGIRQGQGKYVFPNGEEYIGGFDKGEPNGHGVHTYPTGEKYDGDNQIVEIYLNKTNNTFDNINVTTNDLEIFEDGKRVDKYDKKYPNLLIKLRPKQSFKFKAELMLGVGAVNNIWSSVANMYHEEISRNKYKITMESLGQMDEYEALHKSCRIMQILMSALKEIISDTYNDSEISKQNKLILKIENQDYSVGAVLNEFLQLNKNVVFSGISKPDHFINELFIKIRTAKPNPVKYVLETIDHINNIYSNLEKQILKLGKKYITYKI